MSERPSSRLTPHQLSARQDLDALGFSSTDDLDRFAGILGQDQAIAAIQFGVAMKRGGYNIFVMGETGTGRSSFVRQFLAGEAKRQRTPSDWLYVNNFDNAREPRTLELPAGMGTSLLQDFEHLVDQLMLTFPAAFENPTYQQRKSAIERAFNIRYDRAIDRVEQEAVRHSIALYRDAGAFSFSPIREGKPLDEADFAQLSDAEREEVNDTIQELETALNDALVELPTWKRESSEELRSLNKETIDLALEPLLGPLEERYALQQCVLDYIAEVKQHLHRSVVELLADERSLENREDPGKRAQLVDLYLPNAIIGHEAGSAAPVVIETHPSYKNLFGRVEYSSEMGALVTNYRQIRPGSLHAANGGYLVIEAEKLLEEPFVWEALKRALKDHQLKVESPYSDMGLMTTVSLNPEIIPLDVKIVLVGSRRIHYLLQELDPDFQQLFRVLVDFEGHLPRNDETVQNYSRLLKSRAEDEGYPPLAASAVARMVEESSRQAEHQEQLSACIGDLFDLLAEANFLRRVAGDPLLEGEHIDRALATKSQRTGRISREILQDMLEGTILIDTDGEAVGKINGLTVLSIGDTSFGQPARITATVYPGSQGIVDIEREVALGQAIHSKGVMILSGLLGSRYAQQFPLAISASLTMEQSYGYIDGDSASLAEFCCLISALTSIPLRQDFAITGSINQHGEVQPIGGVNEKIEGFFRLCQARGLTGRQGVIIPQTNIRNLMLHREVIEAVEAGQFHVHAVANVDDALELLTGREAGTARSRGAYPRGTINSMVVERLRQISEQGERGPCAVPRRRAE